MVLNTLKSQMKELLGCDNHDIAEWAETVDNVLFMYEAQEITESDCRAMLEDIDISSKIANLPDSEPIKSQVSGAIQNLQKLLATMM